MMTNDEIEFICHNCINDTLLKGRIRSLQVTNRCCKCEKPDLCISLPDLAEQVHKVFQQHFFQTPEEPDESDLERILHAHRSEEMSWEREGDSVNDLLQSILGVEPELAEKVQGYLSDRYDASHRDIANGDFGEQPYADSALYVEVFPDAGAFRETWGTFKHEVCENARFFNSQAEALLATIFSDLDKLLTHGKKPVVRQLSPEDAFPIWRARVAYGESDIHKFLEQPVNELGPPPSRLARAERMNPAGISVFYGADTIETCITEIRAPVGSQVVLARYKLLRSVRVLDLVRLRSVYNELSHFDPDYIRRHSLSAFLRECVEELGRPILPQDEEIDYLPTQVVSEYLAQRIQPKLDGILYQSAQSGLSRRNIAFFNHASAIESLGGVRLVVRHSAGDPQEEPGALDLSLDSQCIEQESDAVIDETSGQLLGYRTKSEVPPRPPILRLDIDSLCVFEVSQVTYRTKPRIIYNYATLQKRKEK